MLRMATERSGPERRGLGGLAAVLLLVLLAGTAWGVSVAARSQSLTGLIAMAVVMAWPLVSLVADPLIKASLRARERATRTAPAVGRVHLQPMKKIPAPSEYADALRPRSRLN
jgi:hypothetical protein